MIKTLKIGSAGVIALLSACTTHQTIKEIKMVSFDDDVRQGQSVGQITADDCNFYILGYAIGNPPSISTAIKNAQTQKTTGIADAITNEKSTNQAIRYMNNVTVKPGGFDAYVVKKNCIQISGLGYR
jgi:hypothetical protein